MTEDTYSDVNRGNVKKCLKESLISFEALMNAPIGIFTSSPEGRIISANHSLARMLGYQTVDELIESITDLGKEVYVNADDRVRIKSLVKEHGEAHDYKCQWANRSGNLFWVSIYARAVWDESGKLSFYREFVFDITAQKQAEEALKEQSRALNERNKELRCLYAISRLVENPDNSIDDILQGTVNILPDSWQYPEVACARIKFEDRAYVTGNFRETPWRQAQDIIAEKELAGCVEIFYLEEKPQVHEGPFLREERDLINAVAERLGRIVERARAQIRLQQSEQKFRDIFNGSNEAVFIQEIPGRFLEVNQVACSRLGYSREQLLHMTPMDIDTDEYAGIGPQRIQDIDQQGFLTFESVHRCKDGSTIDVEISSRKINYEGKSCILSIARDITKRKQAEEELRKIEWMLSSQKAPSLTADCSSVEAYIPPYGNLTELNTSRAILDAVGEETLKNIVGDFLDLLETSVAVYEANGDYALGIFSSDWCRLMDQASYRLCGTNNREQALDCGKWLCHESCWNTAKQAIETQAAVDVECQGGIRLYAVPVRASGEIIGTINVGYGDPPADANRFSELAKKYSAEPKELIECSNAYESRPPFIIELAKRRIHSAAHLIGEIVERKQAEEELKENEKRFRLLVESAPEAIFIQTEGCFAYLNPAAVNLFGADSPEDLLGKPVMDRFHPDYHKLVKERIRMLNQEKKTVQNLKEIYLQMDGSPVDVEVSAVPFNYRGKDGALVFVRDITEQKRADQKHKDLENQLQLSQRMEAVGRLAGGVAHDFNNLLSIILGYGEILLQNMEKDQAGYEPLTQIYDAGIRAKNLTRQLLAFGRKQVLEMQRADINEVISRFNKLIRRVIGEDVDLQLHLNEDSLWVMADTSQIEQILMNLAVNARDAMPEGGILAIETAAVELDDTYASEKPGVTAGNYAMIAVSDTGIGMDQKTRDSVFEPFFTTKEKDKGTGLGLSTCYGIAKQHRGNIWVYSEPGAGTTFKIYLPLDATQKEEKEKQVIEKEVVRSDGTETILVVEDDAAVRQLTCNVLKQKGYNVLESEDVYNAVEISGSHKAPIHLMIVDVIMPGMKGPEVYRNVAEHHPEIKALYMSGYTDNVIAHHGILEKGFQFIQKPFSIKALAAKIREVLDQQ